MRPMTVEEIRRVVEAPAAAAGLVVEEGPAQQIAAEASGLSDLAHLSSALHATWDNRAAGELTIAAYRASGGVAAR